MSAEPYKTFLIYGGAAPAQPPATGWYPKGIILVQGPGGSVVEKKRLEKNDVQFRTREDAQRNALELCRAWIDENGSRIK